MNKLTEATTNALGTAYQLLEADRDAAQEYFDNKSEKWQESDKGTTYQCWVDELTEILDAIDNCAEEPG